MQTQTQNQTSETEQRPVFVKSQNFRHSKNLQFPNEPPTDRQVKLLVKLGVDPNSEIPKTRLEASEMIQKLLGKQNLEQINAYRKKHGLPLKEEI